MILIGIWGPIHKRSYDNIEEHLKRKTYDQFTKHLRHILRHILLYRRSCNDFHLSCLFYALYLILSCFTCNLFQSKQYQ